MNTTKYLLTLAGTIAVTALIALAFVFDQRVTDTVLYTLAGTICGAGLMSPVTLILLALTLRHRNQQPTKPHQTHTGYQPSVIIVPPGSQLQPPTPAPASWETGPITRQFTVVGDNGDIVP